MFEVGTPVSTRRFFADGTWEIDYGYVTRVHQYSAEVRFGDGVTESRYFNSLRKG